MARIFPESLDSIIGATEEAVHSREGGAPLNANPLAEPWFCPSHTCVGCHALQSTASRVTAVDMPVTLLAQQLYAVHCSLRANQHTNFTTSAATSTLLHTSNPANSTTPVYKPQASHTRNTLRQKALRVCSTCPFAVCGDCEEVLGGGCGVLQQRRFADVRKPSFYSVDFNVKLCTFLNPDAGVPELCESRPESEAGAAAGEGLGAQRQHSTRSALSAPAAARQWY